MSISEFFIGRPVFATILNVLFVVVGVLGYTHLTTREYPKVSLPVLTVSAFYINASAEVVESELTSALEDVLAGLENLTAMTSSSREGGCHITLEFEPGTEIHQAVANVRDAIARVRGFLPKDVLEPVIQQEGMDAQPFLYISVSNDRIKQEELTHQVNLKLKNHLRSIKGVAQVQVMGPVYKMNIELDRLKMFNYRVSPEKVVDALSRSNVSLPGGKLDDAIPITLDTALKTPEQFRELVIKKQGGVIVRLKDIADVTLRADDRFRVRIGGVPGVIVGVVKSSDGNPLEISNDVQAMLPELRAGFVEGTRVEIDSDNSDFIRSSLTNIKTSIAEAVVLVILIIFLFLRNLRSTLVPLLTIPVSLVGTFAFMYFFGFSVNTITLLAMVLAVGLVVDDAIVVLENIHRHIENGLSPLEASKKGSREIAFAIVAMTLTLASVYAPIAFIGGTVGTLFIEFALTLAGSVIVSGIVALTLSPMMCARLLKAHQKDLFPKVEKVIQRISLSYEKNLARVLARPKWVAGGLAICLVLGGILAVKLPGSIAPKEDRGFVGIYVEPLVGKSMDDFDGYVRQVERIVEELPEVRETITFVEPQGGQAIAALKPWSKRKRSAGEIVAQMRETVADIPTVSAHPWSWDSGLPGVGGDQRGAELMLSIQTTLSYAELYEQVDKLKKAVDADGKLLNTSHDLHLDQPNLIARIDKNKMALLDINSYQVAKTLETMFHQSQPSYFNMDGLQYDVIVLGKGKYTDVDELYVTNLSGTEVSLGSFVTLEPRVLPKELNHRNQMRAATLFAPLPKNMNLSQGIKYLEQKADQILPKDMPVEFVGAAKVQAESANTMAVLFLLAIVFIYCILAIQFESFLDPFIVMLTVPLACTGALLLLLLVGETLNIFTQIGLVTLIGLITKHGILLVDFANQFLATGKSPTESAFEAAKLRLRPILMTTGAMVLGTLPLTISTGAGAEARRAIGYVLVAGLSFGTLLTLFVIPTMYVLFKQTSWRLPRFGGTTVALALLLVSQGTYAQHSFTLKPSAAPRQMTLTDVLKKALSSNEDISIAYARVMSQKGQRRVAVGGVLPSLDVGGQYGVGISGQLSLTAPLVNIAAINSVVSAKSALEKAKFNAQNATDVVFLTVAQNYYQVATNYRLLQVASSQVERAIWVAQRAEKHLAADLIPRLDVQKAELQKIQAQERQISAKTQYDLSLGQLGFLIAEETAFEVIPPPPVTSLEARNEDLLLKEAFDKRPALKAQKKAVEFADRDRMTTWFRFLPTLSLTVNGGLGSPSPFGTPDGSLGGQALLLANWSLFDGGKRYGMLLDGLGKIHEEEAVLRRLRREISLEVRGRLNVIEQKKKTLQTAIKALELANGIQKNAQNLYEVGHVSRLEFFDSNAAVFSSEIDAENAKLGVDQARLDLAFVMGTIQNVLVE